MNRNEMLATLNNHRANEGKAPLASWKKSLADLQAAVDAYAPPIVELEVIEPEPQNDIVETHVETPKVGKKRGPKKVYDFSSMAIGDTMVFAGAWEKRPSIAVAACNAGKLLGRRFGTTLGGEKNVDVIVTRKDDVKPPKKVRVPTGRPRGRPRKVQPVVVEAVAEMA